MVVAFRTVSGRAAGNVISLVYCHCRPTFWAYPANVRGEIVPALTAFRIILHQLERADIRPYHNVQDAVCQEAEGKADDGAVIAGDEMRAEPPTGEDGEDEQGGCDNDVNRPQKANVSDACVTSRANVAPENAPTAREIDATGWAHGEAAHRCEHSVMQRRKSMDFRLVSAIGGLRPACAQRQSVGIPRFSSPPTA